MKHTSQLNQEKNHQVVLNRNEYNYLFVSDRDRYINLRLWIDIESVDKGYEKALLFVFNETVKAYIQEINPVIRGSLMKDICYIQGEIDMLFAAIQEAPSKPGEERDEDKEQEKQDRERQ